MAKIRFYAKKIGNDTLQINALLQHGIQKPAAYTGYTLPAAKVKDKYRYWDPKKQVAREHHLAIDINAKISKWRSSFDTYVADCRRDSIQPDMHVVKTLLESAILKRPAKQSDSGYFLPLAIKCIKEKSKQLKPGTKKQYSTFIEDVEAYEQYRGRKILISDISTSFMREFGEYLISEKNNYNRTVNRKIGRVITVLRHFDMKHPKRYRFKEIKSSKFALMPKDLDTLRTHQCNNPNDQMHLDAFLFSCETTLRHSDVTQLYPHHRIDITISEMPVACLDLTQEKTTNNNIIPLNERAIAIWDKYARNKRNPLFPLGTSNNATSFIKKICKAAKLDRDVEVVKIQNATIERKVMPLYEAIGYHMSRNTAITTQLQSLSPAIVMANAGLKKMETLMNYNREDVENRILQTLSVQNKKGG